MESFDFIVVGAGSAGCAVASRLSENPGRKVLLIEAGGSDKNLNVRAPLAFANQFRSKADWEVYTEPEPACNNRRIFEPRGKVMGGCSSMNAMLWIRGARMDYDDWGIPGWGWDEVEPFYLKAEDQQLGSGSILGTGGPQPIRRMAAPGRTTEAFVESCVAATDTPRNPDHSGPNLHGVEVSPTIVVDGQRVNTVRAYLDPVRKSRENLTIVSKAIVHKVKIEGGRATGVVYSKKGKLTEARATSEIVLSAGAFGTPQLLQLSGVGESSLLASLGVDCVVDNPNVGAHLKEHPMAMVNFEIDPASGLEGLSTAEHPKYLLEWLLKKTGPLASNIAEALGHVKSSPELPEPDFQFVNGPAFFWENGDGEHPNPAHTMGLSYWTPKSVGWVKAASTDPSQNPRVQLNMLSEREDVEALIRAVRISREIAATDPLASLLGYEITPGANIDSDEQIEDWLRRTCIHTYHPACTARIGTDPADSVIDPEMKVHGIEGLRVADASALREITRANTHAPSVMMGERVAHLIATGEKAAASGTASSNGRVADEVGEAAVRA